MSCWDCYALSEHDEKSLDPRFAIETVERVLCCEWCATSDQDGLDGLERRNDPQRMRLILQPGDIWRRHTGRQLAMLT